MRLAQKWPARACLRDQRLDATNRKVAARQSRIGGPWWMWRTVYLSKLPGLDKKIRVAFDWTLDLLFPKDVCAVYDLDNSRDFEKNNLQLGSLEAPEGCALVERV